ncbi:MAG: hypothetical protein L0Y74_04340 [candidate division Zixibacteria bacterium]|nr:hypothetical protein [candidate division Zixibacteria bacterium]
MGRKDIFGGLPEILKQSDHDLNGRLIEVRQLGVLFPNMASHLMIQFGGEILKIVDEVSANLSSLYSGRQAVHVGEEIFFRKSIIVGETTQMVCRVVHTTEKIIVVHTQIFGGEFDLSRFTLRYEGFSLCGIIGENGKLDAVPQLSVTNDVKNSSIQTLSEQVVNHQKQTLKNLDAWRGL